MRRGSATASAEVLRAAERLSTPARIALDDSSLTSDEAAAIREQASMLARLLSGDQAALTDLDSSDLDRVATELSNVLVSFDQLSAVDERDVEDARLSVFEAHDAFEDERGRRERESDDGEHEGDRTQTSQASSRGGSDDFEASQAPTAVVAPSAAAATAGTAAPTPSATSKSSGEHDDDEHDEGSSTPTPTVTAGATTVPPTSTSTGTATATSTPSSTASATATSTPSATPTSSATAQAGGSGSATIPGNAGAFTWSVGSAGSVAFTFDGHEDFEVTGVNAATGWTASVQEADGSEIRVRFTKSGLTTTFTASREDHSIEVTVSGGGGG
jgi:Asp-tRNA(Asn)/Glu-tRNA(Gln) amidotransferase C subunit